MVIGYGWRVRLIIPLLNLLHAKVKQRTLVLVDYLEGKKQDAKKPKSPSKVFSFHVQRSDSASKYWVQTVISEPVKDGNSDISTSNETRNRLSSGRKVKRISQIINCTVYMSCQSAHKQDTEMINMSNLHRSSNWKHLWGQRCSNSLQFSETCQRIKARLASTPRCNLNWNV